MKQVIQNRIQALRETLRRKRLDAFVIPGADPHLSEYVAPHWQSRKWISGFNGSAGTLVVTLDKAGLWTDSRYFIQATEQLAGTGIELYKEMLSETPSIPAFLCHELSAGSKVGVDGKVYATTAAENLQKELDACGILLVSDFDPIGEIWKDRPAIPLNPAYIYDGKYAGKTATEKIGEIRAELAGRNCRSLLLPALDEIAWTLNLRGSDVKCNPVIISYLLITQEEAFFFIAPGKVTEEVSRYLGSQGVRIKNYDEIELFLSGFDGSPILLNPQQTNYSVYSSINPEIDIIRDSSPVALLKAVRNECEISGVRNAMKKDGVALVKFLRWLETAVPSGKETERSIGEKLRGFRAEQELYAGESFDTIAGYKEHGAIVHYSATPESNATLHTKGFLLLDSGAQYPDGTTDITRTIALGELTEEEKTDYTLVLKGHIALATAKFPAGTRGAQLDVLARLPVWERGMNYLHGTGHGVGHFLCVHEGPQSIRMNENPVALQPGMLTSNEPGIYKAGSHGVRIENLILTVKAGEGMFGDYLRFETVTLCPICKKGIIRELLSPNEADWLNSYHRKVYDALSDSLDEEEKAWLREATEKL
jgi:Xaa-Pro aminopeptidase